MQGYYPSQQQAGNQNQGPLPAVPVFSGPATTPLATTPVASTPAQNAASYAAYQQLLQLLIGGVPKPR